MKKVIRKNQVIITSLAILIAIAGYLNFADVDLGFGEKEASTESSSILDQVDYDLSDESAVVDENSVTETAEVPEDGSTPGEAVLTGASDFAAQAKLSREQVRSQSKADLQAILNNTEVGDDQKQEAVNTMVQMTEIAEKEAAAEMLLEAKGFENAVVNLTGETADVVVPEADLEDSRRAQIEDIAPENIVITPLNESEDTVASEDTSVSEDTADDGTATEDQAEETATYDDQETSGEEIVTEGIYD